MGVFGQKGRWTVEYLRGIGNGFENLPEMLHITLQAGSDPKCAPAILQPANKPVNGLHTAKLAK